MVLGLKKKKGISVQVDYIVSVLEIKPWPPSVPLCSVQTVLIQWENGEHGSGFLPPGVASINGFEDGKIEFNEFFKLQVTLSTSGKNKATGDRFQKNYLEFHMFEPKKDKAVKGQLLGTASINLAQYGIIKDTEMISAPITIKKMSKGMTQPFLYLKIQPFDNEGIESVLRLMSEHVEDESDLASLTDEEDGTSASTHPSDQINSSSQIDEMLNFVAVGLNSEISNPRVAQQQRFSVDDLKRKKQTQNGQNEAVVDRDGSLREAGDQQGVGQEDSVLTRSRSTSVAERDIFSKFSEIATANKHKSTSRSNTTKFGRKGIELRGLKHMKSVRYLPEFSKGNVERLSSFHPSGNSKESLTPAQEATVEVKIQEESSDKKSKKNSTKDTIKKAEWESKIQMLEEELREAAAVEISLYSVVAEHVNSKRKVHAPARRISRFYRHAFKLESSEKRASVARATISGLVVVSKACGNDVSRLTFWLSNTIMLRAIVSQINKELAAPPVITAETKGKEKKSDNKKESQDDWEDPLTFTISLENIEAWIFFRIIESLWWQSFTPHMQIIPKKKKGRRAGARKMQEWRFALGDQEQGKFSINLWKKAFQDAWEKICPIRANGHSCGCLAMPSKSMMEQLVDRLDVAMFNAILRDSDEAMPTDPVSDPISDQKVLPIPSGKSSFAAGARLKNAVGSWSSWLAGFFLDPPDNNSESKERDHEEASYKAFRLLNALCDLMMLPRGMLSDRSTRTEVCPLLGALLIKKVLANFVPDEFSPDPIPESLLEDLDSEVPLESSKEAIKSYPCAANRIYYSPVPAAQLLSMISDEQSNKKQDKAGSSSILRKSYNSDDDLEKMNSPLATISVDNIRICPASCPKPNWMPQEKGGRSVVRYRLLQEAWKNGA